MAPKKEVKECLYSILSIEQSATDEELKKAYRKAALTWHPGADLPRGIGFAARPAGSAAPACRRRRRRRRSAADQRRRRCCRCRCCSALALPIPDAGALHALALCASA
jgi:hypothetical protein